MFDGAVKVPLVIRAPQLASRAGGRRDQLAALIDLLPTLCGLNGLPVPGGIDGVNLEPVLRDPAEAGREMLVAQCLRSPGQKYMVRTKAWKYVYHERGATEELYDTSRSDYEKDNLAGAAANRAVLEDFCARLVRWCRENGDAEILDDKGDLRSTVAPAREDLPVSIGELGWRPY